MKRKCCICCCHHCLALFHNLMKIKIPSIHFLPWITNAGHTRDKIISLHQNHNCVSKGFDKSIKRTAGIFCSPLNKVVDHTTAAVILLLVILDLDSRYGPVVMDKVKDSLKSDQHSRRRSNSCGWMETFKVQCSLDLRPEDQNTQIKIHKWLNFIKAF